MNESNFNILAIVEQLDYIDSIKALLTKSFPYSSLFTASSGKEGLKMAAHTHPTIIILDTILPDMDGFELCKLLKEDASKDELFVVFLIDAIDRKQSRILGMESGGDAFLLKPIDESELNAQIIALIKTKQSDELHRDENSHLAWVIAERTRELEQTHIATLKLLEDLKTENEKRQLKENELKKSEERLLRAELASKSGNWEFSIKDKITSVSAGYAAIFGVDKRTVNIADSVNFILPEYREYVYDTFTKLLENNTEFSIVIKIQRADNAKILDLRVKATYDEEKQIFFGIVWDITEQKKISEALNDSESLHEAVMTATPDIVIISKVNGVIDKVSSSALITYGYNDQQLIGKEIKDFILKDDWPKLETTYAELLKGNPTGPHEYRSYKNDGSLLHIEVKAGLIKNENGEVNRVVYVARDITERKENETKLIKSETEFRAVWENSASGLRISDKDGIILRVNKSFCDLFKVSEKLVVGTCMCALYSTDIKCKMSKEHKQNFINKNIDSHIEKKFTLWNNELKWLQIENSFLDIEGNEPLMVSIFTDITERKNTEEKILHISRLYALVGQVNLAITRNNNPIDLIGRICEVAKEYGQFSMATFSIYNEISNSIDVVHCAGDDDGYLRSISQILSDEIAGPEAEAIRNNSIVCINDIASDNSLLWQNEAIQRGYKSFVVVPLHFQGSIYGVLNLYATETEFFNQEEQVLIREIAEDIDYALNAIAAEQTRKQAEEALIESENRYNSFVNNNVDLIFVKDENRRYLLANQTMANFFNKDIEDVLNKTDDEIVDFDVVIPCMSSDLKVLESDEPVFVEEKIADRYYETTKFRMPLKGGKIGIGGILHDITHRKKSEKALEESRIELKAIYDNAPVMLCMLDENKEIVFQNKEFDKFTYRADNFDSKQLVGDILLCINAINSNGCGKGDECEDCKLYNVIQDSFDENEGKLNFEHKASLILNGKIEHCYLLCSTAIINTAGTKKLLLTLYDITSRKNAEEALQKSEMFLRTFIDNSPFQIWARDTNQIGILENKMMVEEFGSIIGKKPSEIKGLDPEIAKKWEEINEAVIKGHMFNEEIEYKIKDTPVHYDQIIFPIYLNKHVVGIAGFDIDITERIISQKALKESQEQLKNFAAHLQNVREEERVVLAREIHDDLGQILVAIKIDLGLLGIKARKFIRDDATSEFMEHFQRLAEQVNVTIKTARRIMTNLRPEVLDMLGFAEAVKSYLDNYSERFSINCIFENSISDFKIDSQHSVALFRIIQESLNNVLKHAYATEVKVSVSMISDDRACIEVVDNGKGFDINRNHRTDSYGLIGMKERAYLLEADFSISSQIDKGTTVRIEIPYQIQKEKKNKKVSKNKKL